MDKPTAIPAYVPPLPSTDNPAATKTLPRIGMTRWQHTEKASFESALKKMADRTFEGDPVAPAADIQSDAHVADASDDTLIGAKSDELTEYDALTEDQPLMSLSAMSHQSTSQTAGSSDTLAIDMLSSTSELAAGLSSQVAVSEAVDLAHGAASPASTRGDTQLAETVAQMLARLDRPNNTQSGSWQFTLLNDRAGVNTVHLHRNLSGDWRINVSFSKAALADEKQQADALKSALIKQGHAIDSVVLTPLPGNGTFDDD